MRVPVAEKNLDHVRFQTLKTTQFLRGFNRVRISTFWIETHVAVRETCFFFQYSEYKISKHTFTIFNLFQDLSDENESFKSSLKTSDICKNLGLP